MRVSVPRLHSVQLKSGGAKVRVFSNPKSPQNITREFLDDAYKIARLRNDDIVGFAIVAWSSKGDTSTSLRIADGRWVGYAECPDFIKNAITIRLADTH